MKRPCLTLSLRTLTAISVSWAGTAMGWLFAAGLAVAATPEARNLNVLFIGNSFTGRHNLSQVVKSMAEAGQPGLTFDVTTVLYGGRTLKDHWRLGSQNFVKLGSLTAAEVQATIAELEAARVRDPKDSYAASAIARQKQLLASLPASGRKWDFVVLQSYRDDTQGEASAYLEYAPKFAALARAQGGRVVLYETTPLTQHARPLTAAPEAGPVLAKERLMAALASRLDAVVVPMAMVALRCQTVRPDLTLRFVNDAHLNQTMAYLTACTFQAALFGRSPEGLALDRITDTRSQDGGDRNKDRDGGPITRVFTPAERAALQRIAWEGYQEFQQPARSRD